MSRRTQGESITRRRFLQGTAGAAAGISGLLAGVPRVRAEVDPDIYRQAEAGGFPRPHFVDTNGIRMAVYEQGEGFPVVFSHGFPELGYSWRHQLPALADAGFRAIAPDQRGYGRTSRPEAIAAYDIHHLCGDLAGLLDALEIEQAVFCGHDWGGLVVWQMAHLHPDRVAGVIGVNTPYNPRPPMPISEIMRQTRGEDNYIVFFQEPDAPEALLEKDVEKTFTAFFKKSLMDAETFARLPEDSPLRRFNMETLIAGGSVPGDLVVSEEALRYYVATFEDTGFTGGINWYRNLDRNWRTTEGQAARIDRPCLYVGAEDDVVLPPSSADGMGQWIADLEKHVIEDCGHWTQQEKPEELNTILIGWLTKKFM